MKKTRKLIIITIIMLLLFIGNGYAQATNELMRLATINQTEFKVRFSGEPKVSDKDKVKAVVTNDTNATINVTGLTKEENFETVTYIIQNTSIDLSAELSIETTNNNKEYFSIEPKIDKTILTKGEATKITIKIELLKELVNESQRAVIGIKLNAKPIQPTEDENKKEETNEKPSQTTQQPTTNKDVVSNITNKYNYYEKDETPKTGSSKFIDVYWR